jgi:APA family basic amino acid/polyamine antiporter
LDAILATAERPHESLRRSLGWGHVTLLGIGGIIGAGIFAIIGTAAAGETDPAGQLIRMGAGPSLTLSFVITALVCALTALCYAEMASMVPISGSAYTYAYATLGEVVAWIIGWDLMLEYAIGNTAVAISWANYFHTFLEKIGIHIPLWLCTEYTTAARMIDPTDPTGATTVLQNAPLLFGSIPFCCNVLAFLIVMVIMAILLLGIKESARFNAAMVAVKIAVLLFFVAVVVYLVSPGEMVKNWTPFQPNGWTGTLTAAAVVFFAFIGFDAVSTVAEETKNPSRDLPIGIIMSLVLCTLLYIVVAAVFTGVLPYETLAKKLVTEKAEPLTMALDHVAPQATWAGAIVAFGSVVAHTAVLLVFQLGQSRIFFSMARDGLIPHAFAKVHPQSRTPYISTILTGLAVGVVSCFASLDNMVNLTNIGTLFAFVLVCIGIPILRWREPNRHRPFRVPLGPVLIPALGAISCLGLMWYLPPSSWWRFIAWLTLGMAVYLSYSYSRSEVGRGLGRSRKTPAGFKLMGIGLFLIALALLIIPHNLAFADVRPAVTRLAERTIDRTSGALLLATVGALATIIGGLMPRGGPFVDRPR